MLQCFSRNINHGNKFITASAEYLAMPSKCTCHILAGCTNQLVTGLMSHCVIYYLQAIYINGYINQIIWYSIAFINTNHFLVGPSVIHMSQFINVGFMNKTFFTHFAFIDISGSPNDMIAIAIFISVSYNKKTFKPAIDRSIELTGNPFLTLQAFIQGFKIHKFLALSPHFRR